MKYFLISLYVLAGSLVTYEFLRPATAREIQAKKDTQIAYQEQQKLEKQKQNILDEQAMRRYIKAKVSGVTELLDSDTIERAQRFYQKHN